MILTSPVSHRGRTIGFLVPSQRAQNPVDAAGNGIDISSLGRSVQFGRDAQPPCAASKVRALHALLLYRESSAALRVRPCEERAEQHAAGREHSAQEVRVPFARHGRIQSARMTEPRVPGASIVSIWPHQEMEALAGFQEGENARESLRDSAVAS